MFKKIYATTRVREFNSSLKLDDISLNGKYTTIFFTKGQFLDYEKAGITKMSNPIPNDRFIATIPKIDENENIIGEVPKLTKFMQIRYSDKFTDAESLSKSVEKSGSDTDVQVFVNVEETITWIKENTNLESLEGTDNTFIIYPEKEDIDGVILEPEYLIID